MQETIKEYFTFNKKERNGILVLVIIIVIILIFNKTVALFDKPESINYTEFETQITEFKTFLIPKAEEEYIDRLDQYIIDKYDSLELFNFNPNTTTSENWLKLGLTEKQITTINKYLERGGKFYSKDDFQKIYGIRQKQYEILKPYILLPNAVTSSQTSDIVTDINKENEILTNFNPNTASDTVWKSMGVSEKQISTIKKYLSKGGKFSKKEDLLKIYGFDQTIYSKIEPYLIFEEETLIEELIPETFDIIEINTATQEEIAKLFGEKDYYSAKIVKYRDLLGGFKDKSQLLEVYGLKEFTYNKIKEKITVDATKIVKIRLNFCEFNELNAHPYVDYETTKAIIKYRDNNGAFTNIDQLLKIEGITQEVLDKLKNYLTVE